MLTVNNLKKLKSFVRSLEEPMVFITQEWLQGKTATFWAFEYTPTEIWVGIRARTAVKVDKHTDDKTESVDIFICLIPCIPLRIHFQEVITPIDTVEEEEN